MNAHMYTYHFQLEWKYFDSPYLRGEVLKDNFIKLLIILTFDLIILFN